LTVHTDGGSRDQRFASQDTRITQNVSCGHVVRSIHHNVHLFDQGQGIFTSDKHGMWYYCARAVEIAQRRCRRFNFVDVCVGRGFGMYDLPMKV
jgi:hypothetical protein